MTTPAVQNLNDLVSEFDTRTHFAFDRVYDLNKIVEYALARGWMNLADRLINAQWQVYGK